MSGGSKEKRQTRQSGAALKGMRSCIACRERALRVELVRLVATQAGRLEVDRHLKAPGRGAHICYDASCIEVVGNGKVLNRAFKRVVTTADPERIRADIVSGIDARIGDLLSIGRRAGKTVSGIDTLLRKSARLGLLILASDIAEDSKRKLAQAVRNHDCLVVEYSDASGLGRTQGQEHRVAIGVKDSEMAARLVIEFERRRRVLVAT